MDLRKVSDEISQQGSALNDGKDEGREVHLPLSRRKKKQGHQSQLPGFLDRAGISVLSAEGDSRLQQNRALLLDCQSKRL